MNLGSLEVYYSEKHSDINSCIFVFPCILKFCIFVLESYFNYTFNIVATCWSGPILVHPFNFHQCPDNKIPFQNRRSLLHTARITHYSKGNDALPQMHPLVFHHVVKSNLEKIRLEHNLTRH